MCRILAALDTLAKGVHRVLVPQTTSSLPGTPRSSRGSNGFAEAGSNYHFLTQTDIIRFVVQNEEAFAGLLSKVRTLEKQDNTSTYVVSSFAFTESQAVSLLVRKDERFGALIVKAPAGDSIPSPQFSLFFLCIYFLQRSQYPKPQGLLS